MDNYKLSRTIDSNPKALGLTERERQLIERTHQATGATLAVCFLELIAEEWNITDAIINISHATN